MTTPAGKLLELVQKLDALAPAPTLIDLAQALETSRLTIADVQPYVLQNTRNYNRALVALRERYELLVMTWLPGQASAPHDHAGSICVMQVLQGDAAEGSLRVAADGYVDADYETVVRCGEITSGEDAGVHAVRNFADAKTPLVTVHVYAPPLRDFRRFVIRPATPLTNSRPPQNDVPTVAVIGGGFSGSMAAAQIIRRASALGIKARVVVVERRGAVGEGIAYGTRESTHLLNVPAGRMSAWPERPDDFVRWAAARDNRVRPDAYLPRQMYGEYVRDTLLETARAASPTVELSVQFDEARRVARRPDNGWLVHLARGASVRADAVVLAIGHRPPSDPLGNRWNGPRTRMIADPWRPFAMSAIRPDESVVVLGAGLTAVDAVLSLAHPQRRAPITVLSRRGLLPQAHAAAALQPIDMQPLVAEMLAAPDGVRALEVCRRVRRQVRASAVAGVNWRRVVDGLRPHTAKLWQAMPSHERRRFLARLRPFWEVHRHRMALSIGERFGELRDCEWVHLVAGRVLSARGERDLVHLVVAERGSQRAHELDVDWVVNCTGPAPSNNAASNPAIGSLLVDHWLKPDDLGLGVETTAAGNALAADGQEVPDLFIIGTLRKPLLWESTAVPELRMQAAEVADRALSVLTGAPRQSGASI